MFTIYQLVQDFFHPQNHVISLLWVCLKTRCTHVISCSLPFESEHDHYAVDDLFSDKAISVAGKGV